MVKAVCEVEQAVGKVTYHLTQKQKEGRAFSRSLYVIKDIKKGEVIMEENVRSIRPGYGMHPKEFNSVLGQNVKIDIEKGTPVDQFMIFKNKFKDYAHNTHRRQTHHVLSYSKMWRNHGN